MGSSEKEAAQSLENELADVERGLERNRNRGRAIYNSVSDQLGSIQARLSLLQQGDESSGSNASLVHSMSQRLSTAMQAHSSRMPLSLLRSSQTNSELQRQRSSRRASDLLQTRAQSGALRLTSLPDLLPADSEENATAPAPPIPPPEIGLARSTSASTLVASRAKAEHAEGFEVDVHGEVTASFALSSEPAADSELTPVKETRREDSELSEDGSATLSLPETPVLLTKTQSISSMSSLPGSIRLPPQPGSVVYSWGVNGVQSLHDDDQERSLDDAKLESSSRIGRPGAPAVLSVATSSTHTACSTATGEVLTCGSNLHGAVDPNRRDEAVIMRPSLLESLGQTRVVQVSCGVDHTAALSGNGSILTWGCNDEGQLGHRKPYASAATEVPTSFCGPKALLMTGGRRAASVACGHKFTLVLTTRMSVLACGVDEIAGFGNAALKGKPRPLPSLEGLPLAFVAAGDDHAVALTAHGVAFAWGKNEYGCCGRPYPKKIRTPVPIHVPATGLKRPLHSPEPFSNWATWNQEGGEFSLADDVAVVHAACGGQHTVLVTRSGRLLVCGDNSEGQLGLVEMHKEPVSSAMALAHPLPGRSFKAAEAGQWHTLLLDSDGDVWEAGFNNLSGPHRVLTDEKILTVAAGGKQSIAVAAGGTSSLKRQFSLTEDDGLRLGGPLPGANLEELLSAIEAEGGDSLCTAGQELAKRTEQLLMHPAVMNAFFMDPAELLKLKDKVFAVSNGKVQQAVATAIERGICGAMDSIRSCEARMMYPEAVRCLLLYLTFFDRPEGAKVTFDVRGACISSLCDTILGLPFEGYKALLTWATTLYRSNGLYVKMLVRPLIAQLKDSLDLQKDADGVVHSRLSRRAVPSVVGVLHWLYKASQRVGSLSKPEDFYSEGISKVPLEELFEDLRKYKKANKAQRASSFFFCASPFLISPGTKRDLLQIESQIAMFQTAARDCVAQERDGQQVIKFDPFWELEIEREQLLEQTLDKIKKTETTDLRKKLRVIFKGEEGIDAGGVAKEFFQLLSEDLFDVSNGMWTDRFGDQLTWFNSDCTWQDETFELTGILVGLALYNSVLLDVHFPNAVYRKLLGLPLGLEDMVDEDIKRGLQQLLDYEEDDVEDIFCLTFEVTWMDLGEEKKIELKPGGSDAPVTSANKEEYVLLYVRWLLVDSIYPQWDAFERGVMRVMDGSSLDLFSPEELQLLILGTPELDFSALESKTEYEGGYDKDSVVVQNFWRFVKGADRESQIQFLKFATGSSMAPIGGLGALGFKIQRAGPDSPQLPTSHTCFNTLLLPDYGDNYEKLAELLGRAILECEGFGMQ